MSDEDGVLLSFGKIGLLAQLENMVLSIRFRMEHTERKSIYPGQGLTY
jgi:hypothetical protein